MSNKQKRCFAVGDRCGTQRITEYVGFYEPTDYSKAEAKTQHHYRAVCVECGYVHIFAQIQLKKMKPHAVACGKCCARANTKLATEKRWPTKIVGYERPSEPDALWWLWVVGHMPATQRELRKPFDSERDSLTTPFNYER